MANTEVAILGGGPAGLAAAIALRQRGIGCMVLDALEPPLDKACGEGLMPDAVAALRELGVEIAPGDGHGLKGICFNTSAQRVEGCFPNGTGMGMRRTELHLRMVERAREAGADLAWGSRVEWRTDRSLLVNGAEIRFKWLIGADGGASTVRRWAKLMAGRVWSRRVCFRQHYAVAPWSDFVEVHWGERRQAYITPVAKDQICVALIAQDRKMDRENLLEEFPALAWRLKGAPVVSRQRGALTMTRTLEHVARGRMALIGDASGSVDAITGLGWR